MGCHAREGGYPAVPDFTLESGGNDKNDKKESRTRIIMLPSQS
ncbi:MAG: hypothetical protein OJF50_002622 [Nitrospira sp.]|nr:hypothetical protein [Nitrospira sp.]